MTNAISNRKNKKLRQNAMLHGAKIEENTPQVLEYSMDEKEGDKIMEKAARRLEKLNGVK